MTFQRMSDCPMCDAGHEPKSQRQLNIVMEDGSIRSLAMTEYGYRRLEEYLFWIRCQENQHRTATRFRRHMRSIRATLHLRA